MFSPVPKPSVKQSASEDSERKRPKMFKYTVIFSFYAQNVARRKAATILGATPDCLHAS